MIFSDIKENIKDYGKSGVANKKAGWKSKKWTLRPLTILSSSDKWS